LSRCSLIPLQARESSVGRHEPYEHRCHEFGRFKLLSRLAAESFSVRDEIAMNCSRQFKGELHRFIVGDRG